MKATGMSLPRMAWRNVFRNRRRSALNIVALTMGMSVLVLSLGWIGGYHSYIYDTLRDFQTGEIQIVRGQWYRQRTRLPVEFLLPDHVELRSAVMDVPAVRSAAARVVFSVQVSTGRESFRLQGVGIDPRHEGEVSVLGEYLVSIHNRVAHTGVNSSGTGTSGAKTEPDTITPDTAGDSADGRNTIVDTAPGIWIGRPVAEKAGISVGDTLFLRAMNRHGVENLYDAPVVGFFEYGYPLLDNQTIYMDLDTATELLDLDGGATHLVIRLHDGASVQSATRDIAEAVAPAGSATGPGNGPFAGNTTGDDASGTGGDAAGSLTPISDSRGGLAVAGWDIQIRPWQDFARAAVSAVEGDTYSFTVMMAVVYLLIVIGILNSMSMSVHERTREIGTIRAIGIRRRQLLALFAMESVWQALVAAGIALIITTPVALWLVKSGVDIASSMPETMPVPFGERFRADFAPWHYLFTVLSGVLTALAGAIIPARRAGRITVAEAMRTVG
jgi:ABC-type lipoprotein release transport system permease subunit